MRFAEAIFLFQQAEEEGSAEKFVTGMKFASILFAASHTTKHCFISAEFLIWWHCASEAGKVVFEKFVLFRNTKDGKTIYTDRFVERMFRDMRAGVGKFCRRGSDSKIERQAMLLKVKKEFSSALN